METYIQWRVTAASDYILQHDALLMQCQKNVKGAHCSKSKFYLAEAVAWIHFYWLAGSFMQMHHWRHHKIGRWPVQLCFLKVCGWWNSHFSGIISKQVCFGQKLCLKAACKKYQCYYRPWKAPKIHNMTTNANSDTDEQIWLFSAMCLMYVQNAGPQGWWEQDLICCIEFSLFPFLDF